MAVLSFGLLFHFSLSLSLLFRTAQNSLMPKILLNLFGMNLPGELKLRILLLIWKTKILLVSFIDNFAIKKREEFLFWEVQNALSGLKNGRCRTLLYEKGWIMYQKIQSTKTLTLYNTIFVQALPKTASLLAPETQAQQIMKLALNIGLQQAADEFGISYIF